MILCVSPSTNPALDALGNTGLNSDQLPAELYFRCGCASSLAARAGGLGSCTLEASCGVVVVVVVGGRWFSWSTPILLCCHLFVSLPPPYFFSYLGLFWLAALHFTTLNIPCPLKVSSKSTLPSWGGGRGWGWGWGFGVWAE